MEDTYKFEIPQHQKSIIKVIGVGGGGSNAVNHMYGQGIKDVEFVVCNTDAQALENSPVPSKLQIGLNLTQGLGAGANPEKGRNAALESKEEIREMLQEHTKMVFITAGMGGGTGTGAAPVIAKVAKELGMLTVGIVTAPFAFEGPRKKKAAHEGVESLKENCDTVLVILNDKLREIFGNLPISQAFNQADDVLTTAAKGIAEIITVPGYVNVDFEDVRTVMEDSGAAVMGSAKTEGENRALRAAEMSISSPLLNNKNIHGAQKILLSIISGEQAELQMDELTEITDFIQEKAGEDAELIFGHGVDPDLGDSIRVTVIATGFESGELPGESPAPKQVESRKVYDLETRRVIESEAKEEPETQASAEPQPETKDTPEFEFKPAGITSAETPSNTGAESKQESSFESKSEEAADLPSAEEEGDPYASLGDYEIEEREPSQEPAEEPEANSEEVESKEEMERKRKDLEEQAKERVQKLSSNKQAPLGSEDFKEKLEIPAYMRKKVKLQEVQHSSDSNVSKYNLDEDSQILGNNKFLHDNVD